MNAAAELRPPRAGDLEAASGLHILLVDDSPAGEHTSRLLRLDGHRVQQARDGSAALAQVQAQPPDVILLGAGPRLLAGCELIRQLRLTDHSGGQTPFLIALAGHADEDECPLGEPCFDLRLQAPLDPGLLRWILRRFQRVIVPRPTLVRPDP